MKTPYCSLDTTKYDTVRASYHIDILTFNRIKWDKLTNRQREVIEYCTKELAKYEKDNEEFINSFLSSYKVGDVSVTMPDGKKWNIYTQGGVVIPRDIYELLKTTGLCVRIA